MLRPPKIQKFWQNNFKDQVDNATAIEDMLASQALGLSGHTNEAVRGFAGENEELATSVGDALRISWRIAKDQLDIEVNPEFGQGLMFHATPSDAMNVGAMGFTVIGPFKEDLKAFKAEWNTWLEEKKKHKESLKRRSERDFAPLVNDELELFVRPLEVEAGELFDSDPRIRTALDDLSLAKKLGRRSRVTTPNLASLMFYVKEGNRTLLLTGDGHCDDILLGLERAGLLSEKGTLHVNVLKVPHHGSEHNTSKAFTKAITADKYVFCGNGAHENPDIDVVRAYIDSRIGTKSQRSENKETKRNFRLIFNYHADNETGKHQTHLKGIHKLVSGRAKKSKKLKFTFVKGSSRTFRV